MTVRRMEPTDAQQVARVHEAAARAGARAYDDAGRWTRDREPGPYRRDVADPAREALVAERDGDVVGFGVAALSAGRVVAVYVDPEHHREGVGTALLRALEDGLRAAGTGTARLTASVNAVPFYEARGYEVRERTTLEEAAVEFPVAEMARELPAEDGA